MIREITGIGEGNGPFIAFHDGFAGIERWAGYLGGADRIALDQHPYFAFGSSAVEAPDVFAARACDRFMATNTRYVDPSGHFTKVDANPGNRPPSSVRGFGVTVAGEWSNGINSCGLYLNGFLGSSDYAGDCLDWEDSSRWTRETKDGLRSFTLASMDGLRDFFFWTWKVRFE